MHFGENLYNSYCDFTKSPFISSNWKVTSLNILEMNKFLDLFSLIYLVLSHGIDQGTDFVVRVPCPREIRSISFRARTIAFLETSVTKSFIRNRSYLQPDVYQ